MTEGPSTYDQETLEAIGDLLALGAQHGIGITFVPDPEGWTVGYMAGSGGGDLLSGYELGETARASLRPLAQLCARLEKNRRDREDRHA